MSEPQGGSFLFPQPTPKMPRPWFAAQSHPYTIGHILLEGSAQERVAPLGPGERRLGWFVLPPFQRPPVWTLEQKVRFIESIWSGLPIGSYTYNRPENHDSPYDNWLLDGQQRITAIFDYVESNFKVGGYYWNELTGVDQRMFRQCGFTAMETKLDHPTRLEEVYDRLAYGGTAHEPKVSA